MNSTLYNVLIVTVIIFSILLTGSILAQNRAEGLGSLFGGGGEVFRTRRGIEKFLFYFSIFSVVVVATLSFIIVKYT